MKQDNLTDIITDQTERALWEVKNVIDCVPDEYWDKEYCGMPVWKHIYHMLHSLDLWFINPRDKDFKEPSIHVENLIGIWKEKRLMPTIFRYGKKRRSMSVP